MPEVNESQVAEPAVDAQPDPEDFKAWSEWREKGGADSSETAAEPAVGDKEPTSEPLEETTQEGQTAPESEPEGEAEQEEEVAGPEEPEKPQGQPGKGVEKRVRKLTGRIAQLESRIAELQQPDDEEEVTAEAASAPEQEAEAEEAKAPELEDFEDTDAESQWQQYAKATRAFNKAETAKAIAAALVSQKRTLELEQAKAIADDAWTRAAQRYPDYETLVKDTPGVRVSPAMISVAKMDPRSGTEIAYYLATHPEESNRISDATLANNEKEWNDARVKAGIEFGLIRAKLAAAAEPPKAPKPAAPKIPAPPPQPKKVTTAPPPPSQLGRSTAAPKKDVLSDPEADYNEWVGPRNAALDKAGKR